MTLNYLPRNWRLAQSLGAVFVRVAGAISSFLLSILVLNSFSGSDAGAALLYVNVGIFLAYLILGGLDSGALKIFAGVSDIKSGVHLSAYLQSLSVISLIFLVFLLFASLAHLLFYWFFIDFNFYERRVFHALFFGLCFALMFFHGQILVAAGSTKIGVAASSVVFPVIAILWIWSSSNQFTVDYAVDVFTASAVIAFILAAVLLFFRLGLPRFGSLFFGGFLPRESLRFLWPLWAVAGITQLLPLLPQAFLNLAGKPEMAAEFVALWRVGSIPALILTAIISVYAPKFALVKEPVEAAHLLQQASGLSMILSLPVFLLLFCASDIVFGILALDTYRNELLFIVLAGQLVSVAVGPVGYFLAMTGNTAKLLMFHIIGLMTVFFILMLYHGELTTMIAISSFSSGVVIFNCFCALYVYLNLKSLMPAG